MSRVVLLLLMHSLLFGFGMTSNYEAARKQARTEHKILLVLLAKRSDNISDMIVNIMQDSRTSELIDKRAIFVLLYKETTQSYPIEMLYSTSTPALFFLNADELFVCKALHGNIAPKKIRSCLSR